MQYIHCLIVLLLLWLASPSKAQFPDPADPALNEPPPPGGYRIVPKPVMIEDPCDIYIASVQNGKPVITIAANMKKPVPVTYTTHSDDTAMYITLRVIRPQNTPRFQPKIQLPGDTFNIYVGYEHAPNEQGVFTVTRAEDEWTILAVKQTGFIRLGKPPEAVAEPRKK